MYKPECEHHFPIPSIGMCCGYYSNTVDEYGYGRGWAHYPFCTEENCPIKHPELLRGRKLKSEIESISKRVAMIPYTERENKRCFFCNAKESVKYIVEVNMQYKAPAPFRVHACNKCSLVKVR